MAIISINGTALPSPVSFSPAQGDIDSENSKRSDSGVLKRERIRAAVKRFEAEWVGLLELGASTLYWRGAEVSVLSTVDVKTDIAPAKSVLGKICATKVYDYRYTGRQTLPETAPQAVEGEPTAQLQSTAPEQIGFVLGDDYTPPPAEVIGEDGASVNLYAIGAMAWKGIQELAARVAVLEGGCHE
jgi:hypothetical protein